MAHHLELRNHIWNAVLTVPEDVREQIGKLRFKKALGTSSEREAQLLAAPYIAKWKAEIRQARGNPKAVAAEAMRWREALSKVDDPITKGVLEGLLTDHAEAIEREKGTEAAKAFVDVASGDKTLTDCLFEVWKEQLDLAPKTKDQMVKDVLLFISKFPVLETITPEAVHEWAFSRIDSKVCTESSMGRVLAFSRNYWKYLQKLRKVPSHFNPLVVPEVTRRTKRTSKGDKGGWIPFKPSEVVSLWSDANAMDDEQLGDLIKIAAYTGARIEEICSLKVADFTEKALRITDAKTEAGNRLVPVHSALLPLIKKLAKASTDDYLLSGLTFNKYGDRSNAIGKRFGRLKDAKGFGPKQVFHSIRKTLVTQLENAGVSENVAADIVGHEKPRITFGTYSGGTVLEVQRKALEKVSYPFPRS